jgi:hypothetical protein
VGSRPDDMPCDQAYRSASKDGECFLFPETCVPTGFRVVAPNDDTCPKVYDVPPCSP